MPDAPEEGHEHHVGAEHDGELEDRVEVAEPQGVHAAREAGERRRDDVRDELVVARRDAERLGLVLVLTDGLEPGAEARAVDRPPRDEHDGEQRREQVEERAVVLGPQHVGERTGDDEAVGPAGEGAPRLEDEQQDEHERDRHDDERRAAHTQRRDPHRDGDEQDEHARDEPGDEAREADVADEQAGPVGAEPEERGVTERDVAGEPAHEVPGGGGARVARDDDAGREDVRVGGHRREGEDQHDADDERGEAGHADPRAPSGRCAGSGGRGRAVGHRAGGRGAAAARGTGVRSVGQGDLRRIPGAAASASRRARRRRWSAPTWCRAAPGAGSGRCRGPWRRSRHPGWSPGRRRR